MNINKIVNNRFIKFFLKLLFSLLTDKQIVKIQYRTMLKRKLNLKNPKRFTEKIQWYKLHYHNPLMTQCADKYRVREYIVNKGLNHTLVKLYQACDTFDDINFDKLPNQFVIKSNKGSGTNIFIKDKNTMDIEEIKKEVESWETVNTVLFGREWAYRDIKSKIVIEELLVNNNEVNADIDDYKILTFGGKAEYIWVDSDRSTKHKRTFFDLDWNLLDIKSDVPVSDLPIPKPIGLKTMIEIAELIGKDFPFARVDFYWINKKIYFGEITFYPWSGCVQFTPDSFDFKMGNKFKLPKAIN